MRNYLCGAIRIVIKRKERVKEQFQKLINLVKDHDKENIENLIFHLFPDLGNACKDSNILYNSEYSKWRKNLNVCSPIHFDTYFSLIPGGGEEEISQFNIDNFIYNIHDLSYIEKALLEYQSKDKLNNFIDRLGDHADDHKKINDNYIQNLIQALFNISDKLDYQASHVFDVGYRLSLLGLVNKLLKRFSIEERFSKLQDIIKKSSSITLPFEIVSHEIYLLKDKDSESEFSDEQIGLLQVMCVNKIESMQSKQNILNLDELASILYSWSEWSDGKELNNFVNTVKNDVDLLLSFIDKFFTITTSNTDTRFSVKQNKKLSLNQLSEFIDPQYIADQFEVEKKNISIFYNDNKDLIEKTLDNLKNKERY